MFQNTEKPIAVGEAGDPIVAPLLAEIQTIWDAHGIPASLMTPAQFYLMTKAPHADGPDPDQSKGPILAVAARATWRRTAQFLRDIVAPIKADIEAHGGDWDNYRFGGYRPVDYNDAVGGAPRSRHVDGDGLDIIPKRDVKKNNDLLLMAIARLVAKYPGAPIGFGAYAGNGHVDIGGRRSWDGKTVDGKAAKFLDRARQEQNVA